MDATLKFCLASKVLFARAGVEFIPHMRFTGQKVAHTGTDFHCV